MIGANGWRDFQHGEAWSEILAFLKAQIEQRRGVLEKPGVSERDADAARGGIEMAKSLMAFPEMKVEAAEIREKRGNGT